jgi:hypothetical protein
LFVVTYGQVLDAVEFRSTESVSRPIVSERVYYSGWVYKEGNFVTNWKRRFFVLHRSFIRYYVKPTDASPKGEFELGSASVVSPYQMRPGVGKSGTCCLEVLLQKRKWHFYAATDLENRGWYAAIANRILVLSYQKRCEMAKEVSAHTARTRLAVRRRLCPLFAELNYHPH